VEWIKVIDEPAFLTTAVRSPADQDQLIVRRAAMAVPLALGVRPQPTGKSSHRRIHMGAGGLDIPGGRRDRMWLDFGIPHELVEELLQQRVREIGEVPSALLAHRRPAADRPRVADHPSLSEVWARHLRCTA
jgi:hypothetical protein